MNCSKVSPTCGLPYTSTTHNHNSHHNTKSRSSNKSQNASVSLYCPNFTCMLSIPRQAISHMPAQRLNITRLVACKNFSDAVNENGGAKSNDEQWCLDACKMGNRCKFVHVSRPLSEFPRQALHAHYIWRSVEDVTYERLFTGPVAEAPNLRISQCHDCRDHVIQFQRQTRESNVPRTKVLGGDIELDARTDPGTAIMIDVAAALLPSMRVPASRLLVTAGAVECLRRIKEGDEGANKKDVQAVPLAICYQYSCGNECRLAEECPHAHVINLDASLEVPFVRRSMRNVKDAAASMELVAGGVSAHRHSNSESGDSLSLPSSSMSAPPSVESAAPLLAAAARPRYCHDPYLRHYREQLQEHGQVPTPYVPYTYVAPPGCTAVSHGKPQPPIVIW